MRIHKIDRGLSDLDLNPEVQITDNLSVDLIRMRNIAVKLKLFNLLAFEWEETLWLFLINNISSWYQ